MNNIYFADSEKAFEKCFKTDAERSDYMYMYSKGNEHYFKNIMTRSYKVVEKQL
jgi:hypothetical protein